MFEAQDLIIEPWAPAGEKPGAGRVFAAVYPHSDDFTIFSAGLIAKLIQEGYTGYFVRTTNDFVDSRSDSPGVTSANIEGEMADLVRELGIARLYDFNYMNHYLNHGQITELRHRLITIFRYHKVDTVISFDPASHHEENPDHYITALAVEQACWMAGARADLPELTAMGFPIYGVRQKYYISRWPLQTRNRVIDITPVLEKKAAALLCNRSPMGKMAGSDDPEALKAYIRAHFIDHQKPYAGLTHYEAYYHIGK